jgi:tetratricopeptide (TPR) repeat protein
MIERSDWLERLAQTPFLQLEPQRGRMWFPVILRAADRGAIASVDIATLSHPDRTLEDASGARVRRYLAMWLAQRFGVNPDTVATRLNELALVWRVGREAAPPVAGSSDALLLDGDSADLACALAMLGHLAGLAPCAGFVVSGALHDPNGYVQPIGLGPDKHRAIDIELPELPPECRLIFAGPEPGDFESCLTTVFGPEIFARLATAFEQSATSCIDKALAFWRARNEPDANAWAERALELSPTSVQSQTAWLIRAANAIHRGNLALAAQAFAQLESHVADPWLHLEWQCRLAVKHLDELQIEQARTVIDVVLNQLTALQVALGAQLPFIRHTFDLIRLQALGTSSKIRAAAGDLEQAIAEREQAIAMDIPQEHTRNLTELADLLFRAGRVSGAHACLESARARLKELQEGEPRNIADGFRRVVARRSGLLAPTPGDIAEAATTAPVLWKWPQPAQLVATLFATDEATALAWFQSFVFRTPLTLENHPAYRWSFVTACARAIQLGWTDPCWREGAALIVEALAARPGVSQHFIGPARDFVAGGRAEPVLLRTIY